ncbi:MAG: hypothetical protein ABMA02_08530 [Saprospiraceae bacterium]
MVPARQSARPDRGVMWADAEQNEVVSDVHRRHLIGEAQALLTRLDQVKPFETTMPMVVAAGLETRALRQIHDLIRSGRKQLGRQVALFVEGLKTNSDVPPKQLQHAFSLLKLRFNALLDTFDIFADVLNQRSEHDTGIWLAGLDILARDTLRIKGDYYQPPPLICYLDRGHGAAIRRARTRLPGGHSNPVAIIKVPRERMVGSGIGSSLVHEVGHQGAALLDLINSVTAALEQKAGEEPQRSTAWKLYRLWISEILSDFWSVATLGVSATTGLMSVVSLPEYFVFRLPDGDPHPFPWIRVKISIAFGRALYPDPQWDRLEQIWERFYPPGEQPPAQQAIIRALQEALPDFVQTVIHHRPKALRGRALHEVFPLDERRPERLRQTHRLWQQRPKAIYEARPGMVFAVVGQARADQAITPFTENKALTGMLFQWAVMQQQKLSL